jgi:RNA ligase (TIGR02306 family)
MSTWVEENIMSEHICEVVPVVLEKHDNADLLSIVRVRGWQCVVKTADFQNQPLGIYIPIDMMIPDTPEWAWMESKRVKTHKFRGAISQGLLIPAAKGMRIGDDVTAQLGITRYIPKIPGNKSKLRGGQSIAPPPGMIKYTDIENWKNYSHIFTNKDLVVVTEKIHGANSRFAILDGKFYTGSHNTVRKPIPPEPTSWFGKKILSLKRKMGLAPIKRTPDTWQQVAVNYDIENKMRMAFHNKQDVILFGEIYGPHVQSSMPYGVPEGETHVAFFDCYTDGRYMGWNEFQSKMISMGLPTVPQLKIMAFGQDVIDMVDGKAFAGTHIREGIVVKPWPDEQFDSRLGRKVIKMISDKYLLKDYEQEPDDAIDVAE